MFVLLKFMFKLITMTIKMKNSEFFKNDKNIPGFMQHIAMMG